MTINLTDPANKLTDTGIAALKSKMEKCFAACHNHRCTDAADEYADIINALSELQQRRTADKNCFMFGIATPEGNAYLDEFCVSSDRSEMEAEAEVLNDTFETDGYRVVALHAALPLTDSERAELQERRKADAGKCETCAGTGKIDERLGGYSFSNPEAKCPDCDGSGEYYLAPQPIAEIVSKYGDPETFGERELRPIADIQKMPYNSKLYSIPLQSPKIPAGFILVPTTPTQEMTVIGGDTYVRCEEVNQYPTDAARRIWAAMLAATPLQEVKETSVSKEIATGARLTDHRFKI